MDKPKFVKIGTSKLWVCFENDNLHISDYWKFQVIKIIYF